MIRRYVTPTMMQWAVQQLVGTHRVRFLVNTSCMKLNLANPFFVPMIFQVSMTGQK